MYKFWFIFENVIFAIGATVFFYDLITEFIEYGL